MPQSVLLVDDERFARTVYADYLRAVGYAVDAAESAEQAIEALRRQRFDVLVTDMILPGSDGITILAEAKQLDPNIEVVVITALDRVDPAVRAMKSGASDYLVKPVTPEALQLAVQRCLSTRALLAENKSLRSHLQLFETCQRIAATFDRDKLVPMALAAIEMECQAGAAVLFEPAVQAHWAVTGFHGITAAGAEDLLAQVREPLAALIRAPSPAEVVQPDGRTALLLPVADGKELLAAACAVLPEGAARPSERIGSAGLLCRHLGIALRTLGRLRQVEQLAYIDDLTELYNTRFLDLALEREIQGGRPFTVLFLDLDHFKSVNDQYGHLVGSKLLVEIARVLRSCVRDDDVLVRYGGDEYVALLVGIDSGSGLKVAERIRRAIENHRFLSREKATVRITVSIGLASHPEHAGSKAEILDLADRAMYRGKRTTRNVVYMASSDLPPVPPR